jgi:hypothetical protein
MGETFTSYWIPRTMSPLSFPLNHLQSWKGILGVITSVCPLVVLGPGIYHCWWQPLPDWLIDSLEKEGMGGVPANPFIQLFFRTIEKQNMSSNLSVLVLRSSYYLFFFLVHFLNALRYNLCRIISPILNNSLMILAIIYSHVTNITVKFSYIFRMASVTPHPWSWSPLWGTIFSLPEFSWCPTVWCFGELSLFIAFYSWIFCRVDDHTVSLHSRLCKDACMLQGLLLVMLPS